jgi:hypothetical protein
LPAERQWAYDVPAQVCGDCREAYTVVDLVEHVQRLVAALEAREAEVSIAHDHAA